MTHSTAYGTFDPEIGLEATKKVVEDCVTPSEASQSGCYSCVSVAVPMIIICVFIFAPGIVMASVNDDPNSLLYQLIVTFPSVIIGGALAGIMLSMMWERYGMHFSSPIRTTSFRFISLVGTYLLYLCIPVLFVTISFGKTVLDGGVQLLLVIVMILIASGILSSIVAILIATIVVSTISYIFYDLPMSLYDKYQSNYKELSKQRLEENEQLL